MTLLTCNTAGAWVDTQAATYTTAQCETPCDQCTSLLNTGMACLSGFRCKAVLTRSSGQCPEVYCDTGLMTAGSGRTTVTQLSCNGLSQWVDPAGAVYSVAQCETGCTCPALPVTASPNPLYLTRGRDLEAGDDGCSTLSPGCRANDRYRGPSFGRSLMLTMLASLAKIKYLRLAIAFNVKGAQLDAGVTRMDRIRNDAIRQKFGVVPKADKMFEAHLRWCGHVHSGNKGSFRKVGLELELSGRRPCERPKQPRIRYTWT
ncbi:unnamed protein product [Heligmosomoides polygyrus]|uniref:Uncharacterized protein n=1 Tax=Heligmosomoides polygyrus TaxID=6339 RepID=A0A3P8B452_HELPZ|nr:unnamed protein product [Heligmosomoides polygyrus]